MAVARSQSARLMYAASAVLLAGAAMMYSASKSGLIGAPPPSSGGVDMKQVIEAATAAARETTKSEIAMHFRGIEQQLAGIAESVKGIPTMQNQIRDLENRYDNMLQKPGGRVWDAIQEVKDRAEALQRKVPPL